jgi:hypothetical protein
MRDESLRIARTDPKAAASLLERAAQRGDTVAMIRLARDLQGVTQPQLFATDSANAYKWYRVASAAGSAEGALGAAIALVRGVGVTANREGGCRELGSALTMFSNQRSSANADEALAFAKAKRDFVNDCPELNLASRYTTVPNRDATTAPRSAEARPTEKGSAAAVRVAESRSLGILSVRVLRPEEAGACVGEQSCIIFRNLKGIPDDFPIHIQRNGKDVGTVNEGAALYREVEGSDIDVYTLLTEPGNYKLVGGNGFIRELIIKGGHSTLGPSNEFKVLKGRTTEVAVTIITTFRDSAR